MASKHEDLQVPNPQLRKPSMTYVTLGLKFIHLQNKICWTTQALAIKFGNSLIPICASQPLSAHSTAPNLSKAQDSL